MENEEESLSLAKASQQAEEYTHKSTEQIK